MTETIRAEIRKEIEQSKATRQRAEQRIAEMNSHYIQRGSIYHCKQSIGFQRGSIYEDISMTVATTCGNFCRELRKMGFEEDGITSTVPDDAMTNAAVRLKWSERTTQRYLGQSGDLVKFGYLKPVAGGYELTGEDML